MVRIIVQAQDKQITPLSPDQELVAKELIAGNSVAVSTGRCWGKSFLVNWWASKVLQMGKSVLVISPTYRQSIYLFRQFVDYTTQGKFRIVSPIEIPYGIHRHIARSEGHGNLLMTHPGKVLEGISTPNWVIMDEADFIPMWVFIQLSFWRKQKEFQGSMLISSPKIKHNPDSLNPLPQTPFHKEWINCQKSFTFDTHGNGGGLEIFIENGMEEELRGSFYLKKKDKS